MNIDLLRQKLGEGLVIPAVPLALDENRKWSEQHQTALTRYYLDAGAGALAVGVHATQFAIRDPAINLFEPVLRRVSQEVDSHASASRIQSPLGTGGDGGSVVKIAGICGHTRQASTEAESANGLGYHAGLLSMTALNDCSEKEILAHCRSISQLLPLVGFYLQPAVGGRVFSFGFWSRFCEIENVVAIKIAPFNRYQTWDVVRAVIESERNDVALYTGNDDNIIVDLLTPFTVIINGLRRTRFIDGGLLGQWGVWTSQAVNLLTRIKAARSQDQLAQSWLEENIALTDANAAIFDAANSFAGCIPGILEVLRRQGLVPSSACLDPDEVLSEGQEQEIHRVTRAYPHLTDDDFVMECLSRWLA